MSRLSLLRTDDFTGGLNLRADPFQLGSNESPDLLNVDIDPRGGLSIRGGMQRLNSPDIGGINNNQFEPKRLWAWNAATPQVLLSANNKVFYASTSSFSQVGSFTTTAPFGGSFAEWTTGSNSSVYIATGNSPYKWNGSSATALTASGTGFWQEDLSNSNGTHMPTARYTASHVDRLWVAYTTESGTTYPNRIRFSHPFFPESWRSADYIDIVEGGSGITAIVPFNGNLLVFKKRAVFAILGYSTDTFQVVPLSTEVGAVNPQSVAVSERAVYFFSWPDGLMMYDGQRFLDLFVQIRPAIQDGRIHESSQDSIAVSWVNRKVWVAVPWAGSAKAAYSFVYDPSLGQRGAWTKYQTSDSHGLGIGTDFVTSTGTTHRLMCHPHHPCVLRVDLPTVYQDQIQGAADFSSYYTTRWHDAGSVSSRKMWRRPDFVAKQTAVDTALTMQVYHDWEESVVSRTFQVVLDGSGNSLIWTAYAGGLDTDTNGDGIPDSDGDGNAGWNEANWGASATGAVFAKGSNMGLARSVQLRISSSGGKPWGINSITYKFNQRKVRA
ncbi:MAG: hypothetical protein EBZ25_07815 [Flavobacteriia bacterium]|nr:hypothetical protein [Flavobacteriia bacterium]